MSCAEPRAGLKENQRYRFAREIGRLGFLDQNIPFLWTTSHYAEGWRVHQRLSRYLDPKTSLGKTHDLDCWCFLDLRIWNAFVGRAGDIF